MLEKSERIENIALSEIVRISESALQMKAQGHDIIALSTGEPDFPTPHHICEAAARAMVDGQTKYPPTAGTPDLRTAIAESSYLAKVENVIVSTGAKQVIANTMLATLNPGDEVLIPTPFWTSYADIVKLSGGRPLLTECSAEQGFKITPQQLDEAISPRTRWLMLNSPSNPTGAVYSRSELEELAKVLRKHPNVWIISDEIYALLSYVPFTSFREAAPDLADRMIVINGVSKAHSMTGWRIGWGIGPAELIKAMTVVQGQTTSGACSIAQAAALEAVQGDNTHLAERLAIFRSRRDLVVRKLNATPGLSCSEPDGAFYVFPSCAGLLKSRTPAGLVIENDADFCAFVLATKGLAIVPGRAFGHSNHFRLSFAYSEADLDDGCARILEAVKRLSLPH